MLVGQPELVTDQLPSNMYLDNFKNEKEDVTRVPSLNADRMNIYRRGTIPDTYNKPGHLDTIRTRALEHLRHVEIAPGIVPGPAAAVSRTQPIKPFAVTGPGADSRSQSLAALCLLEQKCEESTISVSVYSWVCTWAKHGTRQCHSCVCLHGIIACRIDQLSA